MLAVPLVAWSEETLTRRREPITLGLPWPRGAVPDAARFRLAGRDSPLQVEVLDRWADGSVRWALFDLFADSGADLTIEASDAPNPPPADPFTVNAPADQPMTVDTGAARFTFAADGLAPLFKAESAAGAAKVHLVLVHAGDERLLEALEWTPAERGPVRCRVAWHGTFPTPDGPLEVFGHVDLFAGSATARVQLSVQNPRPAAHPGGNWDLGSPGSLYFDSLRFTVEPAAPVPGGVRYSAERGRPLVAAESVRIHQESSGGDNWRSLNHVDRDRQVPMRFRGYALDGSERPGGDRATPLVALGDLAVAMPRFWENFPKAMAADAAGVTLDLWPAVAGGPHELQGGEQKTHRFAVAFGPDAVTAEPLAWTRSPLTLSAKPEWYAQAEALPYLTPLADDPNPGMLALARQAIEGPDTFASKRETIDEFGWRHYGDIYGDHEAAYHKGPTPLISHDNNQYDCALAFIEQWMRGGDPRWLEMISSCADHTCDIDVYHTTGDKAAYSGGLFWHTYHYADADTGTHRSYPKSLRTGGHFESGRDLGALGETGADLKKVYAVGGGPAGSHNYNAGLMMAYFLTGDPLTRDAAVSLADFVFRIDDPRGTPFRVLSREFTGLATESGSGYYGPGRAAANSVLALLAGHRLTGEAKYLTRAELLIRRTASPTQDLAALDLLNAELRWYYTMFLQALGVYLDVKTERGQLDAMYAYAKATLLHYARWMADHERPILDTPEKLQYPTETWAAQDLRKVEVFQFAAKHAPAAEKPRLLERAGWFFRYAETAIAGFETRSLCRPAVLAMRYGWSHAYFQAHPDADAPAGPTVTEWPKWTPFVPQRVKAVRRAKLLAVLGAAGGVVALTAGVVWLALR